MTDTDNSSVKANYFARHWNGDLSLAKSFWFNLVGINFLSAVILNILYISVFPAYAMGSGVVLIIASFLIFFLIWIWGAVGVWRSASRYMKRPGAGVWGHVACAIVVLQGLSWLGQATRVLSPPDPGPAQQLAAEPPRDLLNELGQETQVLVSKQSSDGVQNEDINVEAAETLGEYSLERMRFHTDRILREMASDESADEITQQTVLVPQNGANFIVTRFYLSGTNHAVQFMRVQGGELTRVLCQSPRADATVTLAGKCQDALSSEIGFSTAGA